MGLLTRDQLLTKDELQIERVVLDEETDEFVFVREMTNNERDNLEASALVKNAEGKYESTLEAYRAKLAVQTVCTEDGTRIFRDSDWKILCHSMSAKKMERIMEVAQKLNRISDEDRDNLVKNSEPGQPEDLPTSLPLQAEG